MALAYIVTLFRLHAKLNEDEEAAKLYNRFIAQAELAEVCVIVCVFPHLIWSSYHQSNSVYISKHFKWHPIREMFG